MDERFYLIGLNKVKGLGPRRVELLLSYFGSAKAIWEAKPSTLYCLKEIPSAVIEDLLQVRQRVDLKQQMELFETQGIKVITISDEMYPKLLRQIHTPPVVLYVKGNLTSLSLPAVAVVGARRCTPYGQKMAYEIASRLAEAGVTVVSGLARGIDSAAHKGSLEAGGPTVAVLGTGVDIVYPRENKRLMDSVIENGAVVSEYPPGTQPEKGHFPSRNRIISGLSLGVLVIEAAATSGSLITADLALEQGRDVFAVPGQVTSLQSQGCNRLIKQGAKLVEKAEDILEEYDLAVKLRPKPTVKLDLKGPEAVVFSHLSLTPLCMEELVTKTALNSAEITTALTFLELKGLIVRLPGFRFVSNI